MQAFVRESSELVHIYVDNEEIVTTPTHPFYVPQKGWTLAIDLRAGDRLQLVNGEVVVVEQIQHELLENPVKVYNFEAKPGDFNVLNVPDEFYITPKQFWDEYSKKFLDRAMARGDNIYLATPPAKIHLYDNGVDGKLTGFGMEYFYLIDNGYVYDETSKMMVLAL